MSNEVDNRRRLYSTVDVCRNVASLPISLARGEGAVRLTYVPA